MTPEERCQVMLSLRYDHGWTLNEIGILFGVTRERVRQIIGNSGWMAAKYRKREVRAAPYEVTNQQLADELGLTYATVSYLRAGIPKKAPSGSLRRIGQKCEERVEEKLESLGYTVEKMAPNAPFDLLVDGEIKIDVKYASTKPNPPSKSALNNTQYQFKVEGHGEKDLDFFVFVAEDDMFVVPHSAVPRQMKYVCFVWPTDRPEIGKYQKYKDKWELLDEV